MLPRIHYEACSDSANQSNTIAPKHRAITMHDSVGGPIARFEAHIIYFPQRQAEDVVITSVCQMHVRRLKRGMLS